MLGLAIHPALSRLRGVHIDRGVLAAFALLIAGCSSPDAAGRSALENDEARSIAGRRDADYRKAQETAKLLRAQLTTSTAEKESLAAQIAELKAAARGERQDRDQLAAEKATAEERLRQAEARNLETRRSLERACSLLGILAGEVATLRSHWREFESAVRGSGVREEDLSYLERNSIIGTKIEELHFELLRERTLFGAYAKDTRPDAALAKGARRSERSSEREINAGPDDASLDEAARGSRVPVQGRMPVPEGPGPRPRPDGASSGKSASPSSGVGIWSGLAASIGRRWDEGIEDGSISMAFQLALLAGGAAALVIILRRARAPLRRLAGGALGRVAALSRSRPAAPWLPGGEVRDVPADILGPKEIREALVVLEEELSASKAGAGEAALRAERSPEKESVAAASETVLEADLEEVEISSRRAGAARREDPAGTEMIFENVGRRISRDDAGEPVSTQVLPDAKEPAGTQMIPENVGRTRLISGADAGDLFSTQVLPGPKEPARTQTIPETVGQTQLIFGDDARELFSTQVLPSSTKDDLILTQVIPGGGRDEFTSTQVIGGSLPEPLTRREITAEELFENDPPIPRIIKAARSTPSPARPRPPKPVPPPKLRSKDQELLAELEEIIGHKIEEPG